MIFDEEPKARAPSGERVPTCAYARYCKARELTLALGETGLRRAMEVAPEELLRMTVKSMGLQPKNQKAYGLLRARIAKMPKPPLHCITWMLAASPIVSLADIVDATSGVTMEDIANGVVVEAEIEKAMRAGAIEAWAEKWSPPLLMVAVEAMWDQGYFGMVARDEFLDRLRNPSRSGRTGEVGAPSETPHTPDTPEGDAAADGAAGRTDRTKAVIRQRVVAADARAAMVSAESPVQSSGSEADPSLAAMLERAVAGVEVALATGAEPGPVLTGVEWLLQLDHESRLCWLAYGRLAALLGRPDLGSPPASCIPSFTAGRILGYSHCGEVQSVVALCRRPEVHGLLDSPPDPGLVAAVLGACLAHPRLSAQLLSGVSEPFDGWERYVAELRLRAEELLDQGAGSDVEVLLGAAEERLSRWEASRPGSAMTLTPEATTISLLRVSARRRVGDFAGANRLLEQIDRSRLETHDETGVLFERAMISAELRSVELLRLDPNTNRPRLVERLQRARSDLDLLLTRVPNHDEANAARGILAALTGDDATAVWHLSAIPESGARLPALTGTIRFHLARARLRLLEPQTSEGAQRDLAEAVDQGYGPSSGDLVSVVEALDAHGSHEVGAWLVRAVDRAPNSEPVTKLVIEHGGGTDPQVRALAETMGRDSTRKLADRFDLLAAALAGAESAGDTEAIDRIVGALDEVVARVNRAEIDERWADMLGTDEALRTALEPAHADALRIDVLRRCGRHAEALGVAKALFYRAAAGTLPGFDAAELLEVVGELGEEAEELQRLSRLVRSDPGPQAETHVRDRPVRILFVGGNESQEAYRAPLDQEMADRYEGKVGVEWFFSGWTSNWNKVAERVDAAYDQADAVVLMTFVRTNFGRWVRRTTGERGMPWIACTGHGRTALAHAIHRAVQVARTDR